VLFSVLCSVLLNPWILSQSPRNWQWFDKIRLYRTIQVYSRKATPELKSITPINHVNQILGGRTMFELQKHVVRQLLQQVAPKFPDAIFYKPTSQRAIALTIDDLPVPGDDEEQAIDCILDAIADYGSAEALDTFGHKAHPASEELPPARATFFLITDHLKSGSTLIERIHAAGHEIANHGTRDQTHADLAPEEFLQQLQEADRILSQQSQQPIRWYRPGRGLYQQTMLTGLQQLPGYEPKFALASMLPLDTLTWGGHPQFSAWYVAQHIFPGAILVLHGGSALQCQQTAAVLKQIFKELRRQRYRVLTLSQLWDLPS
jgi:peptidoglycan-N-acetylglucosamine deacetylase